MEPPTCEESSDQAGPQTLVTLKFAEPRLAESPGAAAPTQERHHFQHAQHDPQPPGAPQPPEDHAERAAQHCSPSSLSYDHEHVSWGHEEALRAARSAAPRALSLHGRESVRRESADTSMIADTSMVVYPPVTPRHESVELDSKYHILSSESVELNSWSVCQQGARGVGDFSTRRVSADGTLQQSARRSRSDDSRSSAVISPDMQENRHRVGLAVTAHGVPRLVVRFVRSGLSSSTLSVVQKILQSEGSENFFGKRYTRRQRAWTSSLSFGDFL